MPATTHDQHSSPAPMPPGRRRWRHRLRSALLLLLTVALLPLFVTLPAQASTPANPRAALAAALARHGISLADATGQQEVTAEQSPTDQTTSTDQTTTAEPAASTSDQSAGSDQTSGSDQTVTSDEATTSAGEPADPGTGESTEQTEETTGSWNISDSVRQFLAGLDISFADGPLTGTLEGSTLTVAIDPPHLPLSLPGGVTLTVTGASIAIDEATGSLTLSGTVDAGNGIGGTLSVTVAHSADANGTGGVDLSSTIAVTGVPLFGGTVDLTGTLAYTAGSVSASVTGTLGHDLVVAPGALTLAEGTSITLSSADGLALAGSAVIGSGDSAVTVSVDGSVTGPRDFSLTVDDTDDPPSFTPVAGLTLTPALTGSITDTAGSVSFDISADDAVTWNPTGDVTVAIRHLEISNAKPGSAVRCPDAYREGDLWVDVTGQVSDPSSGVTATGGACIDLTAQAFTVSAAQEGDFGPSDLGFGLSGAELDVTGTIGAGTVSVSVGASLTLSAVADAPKIPVRLEFSSDGSFVGSASVDLAEFGLGSGTGTLLVSSKEIKHYSTPSGHSILLPAGVTVLFDYSPTDAVSKLLATLNVPVPDHVEARATLSSTGFSVSLSLALGSGDTGVSLLPTPAGGFAVYLDTLTVTGALTEAGGSVSVSGTALLHIPALYAGSTASDVDLTLTGSVELGTKGEISIRVGFDLDGKNGPWTDAFGIPGLSVGELAASSAVEIAPEDAGIPLPAIRFTVNDVELPTAWATAIGEVPGAQLSLTLDIDPANPILAFAIAPGAGQTVALEPLRIANDFVTAGHAAPLPDYLVGALQLHQASLLFAPIGGTDATGHTVSPGASLVFDATIAGNQVHVDGSVGLAPYPHLKSDIQVPGFHVGPVTFSGDGQDANPSLAIDLEANPTAPKADITLTAQFTDRTTGVRFGAKVGFGAAISGANATISLTVEAGQPSYISGTATLTGSVYSANGGLVISAFGWADGYLFGKKIGSVWFSYSSSTGAAWAQLTQLGNQIASWFRNVYHIGDAEVTSDLRQIGIAANDIARTLQTYYGDADTQIAAAFTQAGVTATQIASTLLEVFADSDVQVANALNQAGQWVGNTAYAIRVVFADADAQVASALTQIGLGADQVTTALRDAFNDSQAAIYNAFQQIGRAGTSALEAISGFFDTGSYWIYSSYYVPLYLDDAGGSYSAYNGIIQWTWNGGHNQDWYVLPTDSGYAEIVNRLSGQCLSAFGGAGSQVVQYPCFGSPQQQWYLGVYPYQSLAYTGHHVTNRATGLNLDVYGGSKTAGGSIDTWYNNNDWNQWFIFEPAIG